MDWIATFALGILLGFIPAAIAEGKGRSFRAWWFYGFVVFIVAFPHALLLRPSLAAVERRQTMVGLRKCPQCAEMIKPDAQRCRYCGHRHGATAAAAYVAGREKELR
jgi:hypothetical protein